MRLTESPSLQLLNERSAASRAEDPRQTPDAVPPLIAPWSAQPVPEDGRAAFTAALPVNAEWLPPTRSPAAALRAAASVAAGRDVLLLDLDARLPAHAWPRLASALAAAPDAAVVSPLGGGLAALEPFTGGPPPLARADALCWTLAEHASFETRLWSSACSLWRGKALDTAFALDPDRSLPARLLGRLLPCLYVDAPSRPHLVSAVPLPVRALRLRLSVYPETAVAKVAGPDGRPVVLHILHGWGGGAERFVRDLMRGDRERTHLVLVARGAPEEQRHGERLALHLDLDAPPVSEWPLAAPIMDTALTSTEYRAILDATIAGWSVGAVLVSSLIGHSLDALRTGLPTAVCTHDYYPLWPYLHADFGTDSARFDPDTLTRALATAAAPSFAQRDATHWSALRAAYLNALGDADALLVSPTQGARENQCRIAPELSERRWAVIPHGLAEWPEPIAAAPASPERTRLRVLVPGRLAAGKGETLLAALLPKLPAGVELILLGAGHAGRRFFGNNAVHVLLDYEHSRLPRLVAELAPDVALLPSTIPETWSYALSEMWSLGLPVIATRRGSYAERISEGETGYLVDPEPEAVNAVLAQLVEDRGRLETLKRNMCPRIPNLADSIAAWCTALTPLAGSIPSLSPAASQVLADQAGRIALAAGEDRIRSLELQLAEQARELDARAEWATRLEQELRGTDDPTLGQAIGSDSPARQRDAALAELARLHASRSWRVTAPLRWLTINLRQARTRLQYRLRRDINLARRVLLSVRTRGWLGTVKHVRRRLQQPQTPQAVLQIPKPGVFRPFAVPRAETPRASIIVPVYNQFQHTHVCLKALAGSGDETPFEIIVVDDGSSDETARHLSEVNGLTYHRNAKNLGFIGACNAGARLARGEFLVFLNNDTAVQPGWLDALLATFERYPDAGLAGAKLVYPDGRLQEAGGIVFADGSGWNYGRFESPDDPRFNHVRDADYCSGAAIAVPRTMFEEFGGFDAHYAPAYYEDTDLAMKVRARGHRVLYQPQSVVVHFEGVTSGTDTGSGVKAHQVTNQRKFIERWRHALQAQHPYPDGDLLRSSNHRARRRVLIIDACTPTPDRDSGSLRMVNLIRLLREEGCAVSFFASNHARDGRYTEALQQLGVETWYQPWMGNVVRWLQQNGRRFDLVVVSRHYVAQVYLPLLREYAPQAKFVFDTVDLHYLREQREAELSGDAARVRSAAATRELELGLIRSADLTLVVSEAERALLAREAPDAKVEVLSNVHGVAGAGQTFDQRQDLLFVGGFRHPPNVDAVIWFASEVLPLIRVHLPEVRVHVIGDEAPPSIRRLDAIDGVVVHGYVPDIDPHMDGCRIGLAPLRYGAGVKGKVNLSMAHGQPVVATRCAVEGMHLRDGHDVLIADDPAAFAAAVVRLYRDRELWERLAANGLENVRRHFSFDAAREVLRRIIA